MVTLSKLLSQGFGQCFEYVRNSCNATSLLDLLLNHQPRRNASHGDSGPNPDFRTMSLILFLKSRTARSSFGLREQQYCPFRTSLVPLASRGRKLKYQGLVATKLLSLISVRLNASRGCIRFQVPNDVVVQCSVISGLSVDMVPQLTEKLEVSVNWLSV
jgi:hypothetical protein